MSTPSATVLRTEPPRLDADEPRDLEIVQSGADRVFTLTTRAIAATVLVITGGIGIFLASSFFPTIQTYGWGFLTGSTWEPEKNVLGIGSVLVGTFTVALIALVIAFPLSLFGALYIAEYAPPKLRATLTSLVDLMAAVPSIIYGLWGFFLLQPHASAVAHWLHQHLGWFPLFHVGTDPDKASPQIYNYTASAFIAGIAVAMMVIPMACAVMRQVFAQTPPGEREAALALGSTHWGMIRSVVLPFGRGGIIGGTMLGLGRALGETIAVYLIISPSFDLKIRPLEIGTNTVSALIAGRFSEASDQQLKALLAAGFVLFIITLVINTAAAVVVSRSRSGAGADA